MQDRPHRLRRLPVRGPGGVEDASPPESIIGPSGQCKSGLLEETRQKLVNYYHGRGFSEVKVTPVTRQGTEPGEIDLTFVIQEGARDPRSTSDSPGIGDSDIERGERTN